MTRIVITTRTAADMRKILETARKLDIKFDAVAISKKISLTNKTVKNPEKDWILPGEPASDAELEKMLLSADSERGVESENAFRTIRKSLKTS